MSAEYWQELSAPIRIIDILKEGLGSTCHHWCQKLRYIHISKETLLYSKRKLLLPHAIKNQCRARVVKAGQSILEKLALKSQNKKDFYASYGTKKPRKELSHPKSMRPTTLLFSWFWPSGFFNCKLWGRPEHQLQYWSLKATTIHYTVASQSSHSPACSSGIIPHA